VLKSKIWKTFQKKHSRQGKSKNYEKFRHSININSFAHSRQKQKHDAIVSKELLNKIFLSVANLQNAGIRIQLGPISEAQGDW
jgi:hypothetical protein